MKRLLFILVVAGLWLCLPMQKAGAQEAAGMFPAEETELMVEEQPEEGLHKTLKVKFIEGSAFFMSWIAVAFVIGLAFCIERIIYLSLSEINIKKPCYGRLY